MSVVAGGEKAKEIVVNLSPSGVIAVACESELVKGLQAISRIPVIAVPNRRPKGPCRDTVIDLEEFERILHLESRSQNPVKRQQRFLVTGFW
jgi:hypothetical protein